MERDKTIQEIRDYIAGCEDDDGFVFDNKAESLLDDALTIIDQLLEAERKLSDAEKVIYENNRLRREVDRLKIIVEWQSEQILESLLEKVRTKSSSDTMSDLIRDTFGLGNDFGRDK
jgi:hypothetical protein